MAEPTDVIAPRRVELLVDPAAEPLPWERALAVFATTRFHWLATSRGADASPRVRPVLAVADRGSVWSTSRLAAGKAQDLERTPRSTISTRDDDIDVVIEAEVRRVTDRPTLERIAAVYLDAYGWPVTVVDDAYDAPYGAPTAGPPPYALYEHRPTTAWAFGTNEDHAPRSTRWQF